MFDIADSISKGNYSKFTYANCEIRKSEKCLSKKSYLRGDSLDVDIPTNTVERRNVKLLPPTHGHGLNAAMGFDFIPAVESHFSHSSHIHQRRRLKYCNLWKHLRLHDEA
jgi:hypothetical protein